MRAGIFGGSFDPVHNGHLALARAARRELKLDRLYFIPVRKSPLKSGVPRASARERVAMLRLALRGEAAFRVDAWELGRPGPSYTYKTLRHLRRKHPRAEWFLLMGGDSWRGFRKWRRWREVRDGARPVVAGRAAKPGNGAVLLRARPPRVSSTEIRRRAARRASLRGLVPAAVERYAARKGLYR